MRIAKLAATTLLSVAAVGITSVTASGEPAIAQPGISGVDRGVGYSIALAPDRSAVTTTLTAGHFAMENGGVEVIGPGGDVLATVPLSYQAADRTLSVVPDIDAAGTTLTMHPADATQVAAPDVHTVALQNVAAAGSIVAGALIGCVVGVVIGIWFFLVGAIIGCGVGGLLGAIIAGDQP
ncbi:hypothetical protein ACIP5Y_19400 [Nocardia sp. NPDC088792]|uniref:hypothetical protein n=1 Tax=Nocardia sp. NPDC088792 TaxID=3364332 RepID=UPI0038081A26